MITVVNKHRHVPTENDEYIGRGSCLGNPYTSLMIKTKAKYVCESREESIKKCDFYLREKIRLKDPEICAALNKIYLKAKKGDVNLVCFCAPKSCHGDIIKKIIEEKL